MARLLEDLLSLQKVSKISYHCIETAKHPFDSSAFLQHDKLTVTTHFVDTGISIYGAILALLRQESYNLTRFKSTEVHTAIKQELHKENYDFVIFESLFAAVYAPNLRPYSKAKFIYRAHNIEHQIWKDLAGNTKNLPKKWYLNQLAYSLKWAERSIWSEDQGGLELILTISDTDLSIIEGQTLTACRYLPASIAYSGQQSTLAQQQLCFLGAFNWKPNAEAVEWFLSQIFPLLKQQHPLLTFHIAGKGAENIKHWQQDRKSVV